MTAGSFPCGEWANKDGKSQSRIQDQDVGSINLLSWYVLVIFKALVTFDKMYTLLDITMGYHLYHGYELFGKKNKWCKFFYKCNWLMGSYLVYSRKPKRESSGRQTQIMPLLNQPPIAIHCFAILPSTSVFGVIFMTKNMLFHFQIAI